MKTTVFLCCLVLLTCILSSAKPERNVATSVDLSKLHSPILFEGDARTAFRDPAAYYHDGTFYLYFTLGTIEPDGLVYWRTAWSRSTDLVTWTRPTCFTPKDRTKNFSSPGCVVRDHEDFVLCLQTYPTPRHQDKYGNQASRIWTMRSRDLESWGAAELLKVKGPEVPVEKMGRMIDPFLCRDKDEPDKWWCFFKQNGLSMSWSRDLRNWTYAGSTPAGENACVIVDHGEYVLFHSPETGIGMKRSQDLKTWRDLGLLKLGSKDWAWAHGRLTAGFVLDLRQVPGMGKALLFFHGSRYREDDPRGGWANWVNLGIAWSDDLQNWEWPGKSGRQTKASADGNKRRHFTEFVSHGAEEFKSLSSICNVLNRL